MERWGNTLETWPDRELVVAFKGGVPEAYDEMYRRYSDRVSHECRKMLASPEDAREATQETFLKAYQALPRFNGEYKLGAWLARIASNVCVDHIRRETRTANVTPLTEQHEGLNHDIGPEDLVVRDLPALQTLDEIQPLHARALKLRNLQGMSHKEIAEQLGMTPMQVKALLHRARTSFKKAWENASGWVFAPVLSFRAFFNDGSKDAGFGAHLPMWTQTATPLLAERVAASAIVVAIAFSGAPSATPVAPSPAESVSPDALAQGDEATIRATATTPADRSDAAKKRTLVAELDSLLGKVKKTADEQRNKDKEEDDDGNGDDGIDPGDPNRASGQIVKTVTKKAEDVLPDL